MEKPILEVKNLSVQSDYQELLTDINFSVFKGQSLAIIGPNGAGKTTLFKALLNLIPYQGIITWQPEIKIGYVPQRLSINKDLPLTVLEFFKIKNRKIDASKTLELVGLKNHSFLDKKIGLLSSGEIQRFLIAWALVEEPDVILFDEPAAGIDIKGEETIYNLLRKLSFEKKLTILLISHDLNIVYGYTDNVLCLNKEKLCYGQPQKVLDKKSLTKLYGRTTFFYQHKHPF